MGQNNSQQPPVAWGSSAPDHWYAPRPPHGGYTIIPTKDVRQDPSLCDSEEGNDIQLDEDEEIPGLVFCDIDAETEETKLQILAELTERFVDRAEGEPVVDVEASDSRACSGQKYCDNSSKPQREASSTKQQRIIPPLPMTILNSHSPPETTLEPLDCSPISISLSLTTPENSLDARVGRDSTGTTKVSDPGFDSSSQTI